MTRLLDVVVEVGTELNGTLERDEANEADMDSGLVKAGALVGATFRGDLVLTDKGLGAVGCIEGEPSRTRRRLLDEVEEERYGESLVGVTSWAPLNGLTLKRVGEACDVAVE